MHLWDREFLPRLSPDPEAADEFSGFGWWAASSKFLEQWSLDQLQRVLEAGVDVEPAHRVMTFLEAAAESSPREVLRCLTLLVDNDAKGWKALSQRQQIRSILLQCLSSEMEDVRRLANETISRLVSHGHLELRDLADQHRPPEEGHGD